MTLLDYLQARGRKVLAITRQEAKLLGIEYPLVAGWVDRHNREIPQELLPRLQAALKKKNKKLAKQRAKANKKHAKIGQTN